MTIVVSVSSLICFSIYLSLVVIRMGLVLGRCYFLLFFSFHKGYEIVTVYFLSFYFLLFVPCHINYFPPLLHLY